MRTLTLDGEWTLYHFPEDSLPVSHPEELAESGAERVTALVPGNVELDLVRAGKLPDPFLGDNIHALRPLEFHEWWYVREFTLPEGCPSRWELVCEGLDTLATVWVNGVEIGRAANMLIPHVFDPAEALLPGRNTLAVRLGSVLNKAAAQSYDPVTLSWERREEGLRIRKAAHGWGWDIMPRAVSAGIWRPIYLRERPENAISGLYYWTHAASEGSAVLGVHFNLAVKRFGPDSRLRLQFHGVCGDAVFDHDTPVEFVAGSARIPVDRPRLWWPKGYGAPDCYTVTARLFDGDTLLAERVDTAGLRMVALERGNRAGEPWTPEPRDGAGRQDIPPDPETQFLFRVNGVPVQVRGTNWVPLDAFHSRDAERLDRALALLDDSGCNMVRCWGGNVYESDQFYDACDRLGILVWQDFAFGCCRYPQNDAFLDKVRAEAEAVVVRLRNHPSLALWAGDNEIDMCYAVDGLNPEQNRISREVLPRVVHRLDPWRAYVPSSPHIPGGDESRMMEQHLWGPRTYYKGPFYTRHNASFIGEIGYHGCPNASSVRRFIDREHLWPWEGNPQWKAHNTYHWRHDDVDRDRIRLMANQVRETFGAVPDTLEDFALASQIVQAEAKKYFVESARLRKWRTSGVLWWNLLDGWPQFSDAVVDHYFTRKLAYEYLRRAQRPVSVVIGDAAGDLGAPVVVCNDTRTDCGVAFRVWDADTGETLCGDTVNVPAGANWQTALIPAPRSGCRLLLAEWRVDGEAFGGHGLLGGPPLDLAQYRARLPLIAALPRPFDPEEAAR
ncbi:MAG: glycoside hydrolase family 2 [Candidatus Hydrogenedens sp.]|nr:glycoside hydrolase family 2 [Candidatus Hydrogenedentota bacterium]NLF57752.1 glycoside hydrolase family 2 [Candidatus Hydrogenedens sp.]